MKLLFDENSSPRLVETFSRYYPGSRHVDHVGLHGKSDHEIWEFAAREGFVLVSKDNDFRQMSFLHGAPPLEIWLSVADADTNAINDLLRRSSDQIAVFASNDESSLLVLELKPDASA